MKIKILISVFIIVLFSACENVLDIEPYGRKTLDEMFTNESTVGAYLSGCYEGFPWFGYCSPVFGSYRIQMCGDAYNSHSSASFAYDGTMTPAWTSNRLLRSRGNGENDFQNVDMWDTYWRNIRRCNVFLSRIATATVSSESLRNRWIGEAKVLRAFYYVQLITVFGAMPISEEPYGFDFDTRTLKKATFKECVDFIVKDCDAAIASADLPWRIESQSEAFRLTRGVAAAIKSRAILFAASDLWNEGQNYWAEAETITKKALEDCLANGYELYSDVRNPAIFGSAYEEHFCTLTDYSSDPIDKESILVSARNGIRWVQLTGLVYHQGASNQTFYPSQELVDAYCMQSTGLPVLDLEQPYMDETTHLIPNYFPDSGYDPVNPYEGRDPRFYASIYYNGSQRKNKQGVLTPIEIYNGGNSGIINASRQTKTGYYYKKYDHPEAERSNLGKVNISYPIFRLAELYLNYAEAAVENGHITEAVQMVKVIRDRVNMPNINPANQNEARLMVRNERRVEMAWEENRYHDIRRWTKPDGDLAKYCSNVTCMWIEKNGEEFEYHRGIAGDLYDKATGTWAGIGRYWQCYTNKWLLYPLIDEEANRLTAATGENWQSPGW